MALKAHSRPRGLLAPLFTLFLFVLLMSASLAQAKNVYEMNNSTEGDPGDGVLRPRPEIIDPVPAPSPRTFNLLFTLDSGPDYYLNQPSLLLPLFFYSELIPSRAIGDHYTILLPARRWHDAP